jgi:hypothetical protein
MSLIRIILIFLIGFLTFRSLSLYEAEKRRRNSTRRDNDKNPGTKKRKVPEDLGEYVDYEEVKD